MSPDENRSKAVNLTVHGFFALIALCILLASCEPGLKFDALRPDIEASGHHIAGVPFFKQPAAACGPAALASVLSFRGRQVDLETIKSNVYLPALRGTLPLDMERYPREQGFTVDSGAGSYDKLTAVLRGNAPVICLLDLGFSMYKQPHYVTVIGFDELREVVIMHDGETPNRLMRRDRFMRAWSRAGNWMMVVKP